MCTYLYTNIFIVYACVCIYIYVICKYIYTCVYIYIHTYTYICKCKYHIPYIICETCGFCSFMLVLSVSLQRIQPWSAKSMDVQERPGWKDFDVFLSTRSLKPSKAWCLQSVRPWLICSSKMSWAYLSWFQSNLSVLPICCPTERPWRTPSSNRNLAAPGASRDCLENRQKTMGLCHMPRGFPLNFPSIKSGSACYLYSWRS